MNKFRVAALTVFFIKSMSNKKYCASCKCTLYKYNKTFAEPCQHKLCHTCVNFILNDRHTRTCPVCSKTLNGFHY